MQKKHVNISIIIVHYRVKKELLACIASIKKFHPRAAYEIIVVDNDDKKVIHAGLHKKFPEVIYIPNENKGYGQANNIGAEKAQGEYLFFLNPDTTLEQKSIDSLAMYLDTHDAAGIVAPFLLGTDGKPYEQGTTTLRPLEGIVCLSFLNKLFPNNPISQTYFLKDWDKKTKKEVDVVPGTAMMIKKDVFERVGGFDPKFFLFFEEFDLCKRVQKLGFKMVILPQVKIRHVWGASVNQKKDKQSIFNKSRFLYFRKHYSMFWAFVVHCVASISKTSILLFLTLLLSLFLNTYRLPELMAFIGDQGWFYLSARDMVISGKIPLVGIASSHPWLHQGALWTYMLGIVLWIFRFNPVSGAYFTAVLGAISVFVLYFIGARMFSKRVGIVAALLYTTSPLTITNARFAYHTSPIPLFIMLFLWSFYQWVKGNVIYFPVVVFFLAILYNLELATTCLIFPIAFFFSFGAWKKTRWFTKIFNTKIIILSLFAFLIPMIPVLIYDFSYGFKQTVGFVVWMAYAVVKPVLHGFQAIHTNIFQFLYENIQRLIFLPNDMLALSIFLFSQVFFVWTIIQMRQKRKYDTADILLFVCFFIPAIGFLIAHTPSDAYIPLFFPMIILMVAICFDRIVKNKFILASLLLLLISGNVFTLLSNNYSFSKKEDITLVKRIEAVKKIRQLVKGEPYNIIGKEQLGLFPSSIMQYEYLLWLSCTPPSKNNVPIKIYISERGNSIVIKKSNK